MPFEVHGTSRGIAVRVDPCKPGKEGWVRIEAPEGEDEKIFSIWESQDAIVEAMGKTYEMGIERGMKISPPCRRPHKDVRPTDQWSDNIPGGSC